MKKRYKLIMLLFMLFSISSSAQNKDTIVVKGYVKDWIQGFNTVPYARYITVSVSEDICNNIPTTYLGSIQIDSATGEVNDTFVIDDSLSTGMVRISTFNSGFTLAKRTYDKNQTFHVIELDATTEVGYSWGLHRYAMNNLYVYTGGSWGKTKYYCNYGDGTIDSTSGRSSLHQYSSPGTYIIEIKELDSNNMYYISDSMICLDSTNYGCNSSLNSYLGINKEVSFNISGVFSPTDYTKVTWDFGDGNSTVTGDYYASHNYVNTGAYNVCYSYRDSTGCISSGCDSLRICDAPPFNGQNIITEVSGNTVNFKLKLNQGVPTGLSYKWEFGDDSISNLAAPSHTYDTNLLYYAKLTIYSSVGCYNEVGFYIDLRPSCTQTPSFTHQYSSTPGYVQFIPTTQSSGTSYQWDFGNGYNTAYGSPYKPSINFSQAGTYEVCHSIEKSTCRRSICEDVYYCDQRINFNKSVQYDSATFNAYVEGDDSTSPSRTYTWDFGDGSSATGANVGHKYSASGSYTVCVTASGINSGCDSTKCKAVTICLIKANFTALQGSSDSVTFSALFPSSNYTYFWVFGDGTSDSTSGQTVKHKYPYSDQFSATLIIIDNSINCDASFKRTVNYNHPNGLCLSGLVLLDTNVSSNWFPDSAIVYLIEHDTSAGTLIAIDSVVVTPGDSGHYQFCGVNQGKYLIKAALLSGDPNYSYNIPTYYWGSTQWGNANEITAWHTMGGRNISMVGGTNMGGPGFIGGLISAGANKTNNLDELILTIILKDANGKPIAYSEMDANHEFSFDGLPYGTYKLAIDVPGRTTAEYTIVLSPTSPKKEDADFIVNSTYILTSVKSVPFVISNNVYPNPASDVVNVDLDIKGTHTIILELVDMQGRVVATTTYDNATGANTFTLSTNEVQAGVYMLKIKADDFSTVNKIIISK